MENVREHVMADRVSEREREREKGKVPVDIAPTHTPCWSVQSLEHTREKERGKQQQLLLIKTNTLRTNSNTIQALQKHSVTNSNTIQALQKQTHMHTHTHTHKYSNNV